MRPFATNLYRLSALEALAFRTAGRRNATQTRRMISSTAYRAQAAQEPKQKSAHVQFYAVFARPTLKVLTLAFLTYQICYWTWMKLENESIIHEKDVEVKKLEDEVRTLAQEQKNKRLLEE